MGTRNFNVIGYDTRYWWLLLAGGILFIGLGTWIICSPEKTYLSLSLLLAIGMLATGAFEALFSLFNLKRIKDWGWIFAGGLIDVLLGIYLLNYLLLTMVLMPMAIGIWMLFRGFMTVSSPVALRALGMSEWLLLVLTSMLLILPSIVILLDPFIGLVNVVMITGISFIISGIFRIFFSQQLRKLKTMHSKVKKRKKHLAQHQGYD